MIRRYFQEICFAALWSFDIYYICWIFQRVWHDCWAFFAVEIAGVLSLSFMGVVNTSFGSLLDLSNNLPDLVARLPAFEGSDMVPDY